MKTETDSATAPGGRGYHGPVTWDESHPISPDDFVCSYLKVRGVSDALAESVAREASRALRELPYWHITASGRIEMHLRLFRTLVDAGHRSRSAELTGDLLKEMRERQEISTGRVAPW
jgi:hypothetical protein